MARYYWIGGATGTTGSHTNTIGSNGATGIQNTNWILAFDFNNPLNWVRETNNYPGYPYRFGTALTAPAIGDEAIFCSNYYWAGGNVGLSAHYGSISQYEYLPTAKAPCLFGGATQAGSTVTWLGGATGIGFGFNVGTTFNSSLSSLRIESNGLARPVSQYPFRYIGGGLWEGYYPAAYSGTGEWIPTRYAGLDDAIAQGFTLNTAIWGGTDIAVLASVIANTGGYGFTGPKARLTELVVKTPQINGVGEFYGPYLSNGEQAYSIGPGTTSTSGDLAVTSGWSHTGKVSVRALKNLTSIPGSSGNTAALVVNTNANLWGTALYQLTGHFNQVNRLGLGYFENGKVFGDMHQPRWQLALTGCTVGEMYLSSFMGKATTNHNTQIARANCYSTNALCQIYLGNGWNRTAVNADLGYGASAGSSADTITPNLSVYTQVPIPGLTNGIGQVLSNPGVGVPYGLRIGYDTMNAPYGVSAAIEMNLLNIGTYNYSGVMPEQPGISFSFSSNTSINTIETYSGVKIFASSFMPSGQRVNIGTINLRNSSIDFKQWQSFNNWFFGTRNGYEILGGIIFEDEVSTVEGSDGIRLWNEQIYASNFRSGGVGGRGTGRQTKPNVTTDISKFI